jgi:hypothetical protein
MGDSRISLSEAIQSHLKLHGVDAGIWDGQAGIGDVLIANAGGESAAVIVEKLKAQSRMRYKVYVRRVGRYRVIAEKHSAAQFEIRDGARRIGKVPL